jgi:RNA polymerase-associated protein CTR9
VEEKSETCKFFLIVCWETNQWATSGIVCRSRSSCEGGDNAKEEDVRDISADQQDPALYVAPLLLGLADLNTARDPAQPAADRLTSEASGVGYLQQAFKLNMHSSATALALASITSQSGRLTQASKLAERAIQYSDNKHHTVLANAERGRLGFVAGDVADAGPYIAAANGADGAGVNVMAELTLGQIAIKNG